MALASCLAWYLLCSVFVLRLATCLRLTHESSRWYLCHACLGRVRGASMESKANLPKPPVVPEKLDAQIVTHAPGVTLKLIAEHPALVTPIGIDVDSQGRLWVIASHTHFRPQDYPGPEHDEILVFQADGSQRPVFYNKTDATMHVKVAQDGWVYLAERDRILRVRDRDGDGIGDQEENLVTLDTVSDYPHNGLSGMAWHPDGGLVFSLGENFGKDWVLLGKDGRQVRGRGEGGVFLDDFRRA